MILAEFHYASGNRDNPPARELPGVPRIGDDVEVGGEYGTVVSVTWTPDLESDVVIGLRP